MLNENHVAVDQKVKQFKDFILFCKQQYGLKSLPKFKWFTHSNVGQAQPTFGTFQNEDRIISIGINNRHPLDIMRTIAHELWHYKQMLNHELGNDSGETGSPQENAANAQAGIIMRNWNKLHPEMFAQSPVEKLNESVNNEIPEDVTDFIDTLSSDDVGKERIGDYVVHFEGFSDVCQADAEERTQLSPNDPRYLSRYEDIYKEVLNDFINREGGTEPISAGLAGDELYPVYYAVFHKPAITEAELSHISQYHEDGGSLEGYVVDTDQPQLENYLTSQGAAPELIKALRDRYNRIAIIRNMWVDEELRGGGIGTDLVGQAIGDAFSSGAEAIILVADMAESNLMPLDKWYESFGFKTIGTAGGDPVMVMDRGLNESWSKKYKKSIDCSHPKGFSQKAHCAGRSARQAGKKTKSKSVSENFADGKGPGRPGDSQRHGIPKGATIAQLEKAAKAKGRKGQLARWQLNMRRGRAKNETVINKGVTETLKQKLLDKPTPTVGNLAEKYHTSLFAVQQQLARGIRVEMEHTSKYKVAKEIALDHLGEDLYYYKKLAKVEKNKMRLHEIFTASYYGSGNASKVTLNELFAKPYAWKFVDDETYTFRTASGLTYQVLIIPDSVEIEGQFERAYWIEFGLVGPGGAFKYNIEHTGDAFNVFATVAAIIKKYLSTAESLDYVYFSSSEPSRTKLYTAFMKLVPRFLPGWEFYTTQKVFDQTRFIIKSTDTVDRT